MPAYLNPLVWFRCVIEFVAGWLFGIPWRDAPKAIPAMLLTLVLAITGMVAWTDSSGWRNDMLTTRLQSAIDKEDYKSAELVVMRQLGNRPEDEELLYRLALIRDANEDPDAARSLMRDLVRVKRYEPAARWLLEKEFLLKRQEDESFVMDEEQKKEYGRLLAIIHDAKPKDYGIQSLYSDYLVSERRFEQAIPIMAELAKVQPMRGLQAAVLARQQGNEATAEGLAGGALDIVEEMWEEDPGNSKLALAVAQSQLFLKQYADSIETLETAARRTKSDEERQQFFLARGDAIVAYCRSISEDDISRRDRLRILRMLQSALEFSPSNPNVLTLVADQVLATVNDDDEQIQALRESLINGSSVGISHFIRGTAALIDDDPETATKYLQLASEHMPNGGAILNNLAVAMAMRPDADLEQALKISQSAIEQTPAPTPHFFDTRGQILVQLGRYLEAIPDLEKALQMDDLAFEAHQSLAICYEKIGDKELGQLHREAAQRLSGKSATTSEEAQEASTPAGRSS